MQVQLKFGIALHHQNNPEGPGLRSSRRRQRAKIQELPVSSHSALLTISGFNCVITRRNGYFGMPRTSAISVQRPSAVAQWCLPVWPVYQVATSASFESVRPSRTFHGGLRWQGGMCRIAAAKKRAAVLKRMI